MSDNWQPGDRGAALGSGGSWVPRRKTIYTALGFLVNLVAAAYAIGASAPVWAISLLSAFAGLQLGLVCAQIILNRWVDTIAAWRNYMERH